MPAHESRASVLRHLVELDLSQDDVAVQGLVREIVDREIAPNARQVDENEEFPRAALSTLGSTGLVGLLVPEQYGGSGGTMLQYCLVLEEIASACGATAATYMTQVHGMLPLLQMGSEEQKRRWLPEPALGNRVMSIALTEPSAGSDLASIRTRAERVDGGYLVNGHKVFITNGNESDVMSVFVRTSDERHRGMSVLLIESSSSGVSCGKPLQKMGIRGSDTAEISFTDVFVPDDQRIGREGDGFPLVMGALGDARISTAAQACGLARGAWARAYRYSQQREQFGQRIFEFQAIQLRLMTMLSKLTSAQLLLYQVARMIDRGTRSEYAMESAMAKSYCSDVAMEVTTGCVDVFGGYGYMRDYEVERFMRDAKVTQIYDGTNDLNRIIMARRLDRRQHSDTGGF
jgi:alkylation response protein AidB-like acyl-CoA dehydrogenase